MIKNTFTSIEAKNTLIHFIKVLGVTLIILILQSAQGQVPDQYALIIPFITSAITGLQQYLSGN